MTHKIVDAAAMSVRHLSLAAGEIAHAHSDSSDAWAVV